MLVTREEETIGDWERGENGEGVGGGGGLFEGMTMERLADLILDDRQRTGLIVFLIFQKSLMEGFGLGVCHFSPCARERERERVSYLNKMEKRKGCPFFFFLFFFLVGGGV